MKAVIMGGFRHTVESPRMHYADAELWLQSTSARAWDWTIYDWSRWFDIHDVEPTGHYAGIKVMRPDVLAWYVKQGSERPIYLTKPYREIIGSRAYPIDRITERYGDRYFGCQLDYMGALALDEGFDHWILYGLGQPYVADREGEKAQHWWKHHGTFLYWLRKAVDQGVKITLDTPESNMFTHDIIADPERYPTPEPLDWRYGYDMGVEARAIAAHRVESFREPLLTI
jgi:hypothetical protein